MIIMVEVVAVAMLVVKVVVEVVDEAVELWQFNVMSVITIIIIIYIYNLIRSSKHANFDGAYFGTTFCHLFLLTHTELITPPAVEKYVPRIFGFRINDSSLYYRLR